MGSSLTDLCIELEKDTSVENFKEKKAGVSSTYQNLCNDAAKTTM